MKFRKKPVVIEAVQYTEYGRLVKGMCNSQSCYVSGNTEPHVHTIHRAQVVNLEVGDWIIPEPDGVHYYPCKPDIFQATYDHEPADGSKDLGITEVRGAKANISDLVVYGDGDTFALLCKASSKDQGWMKSTKVANVPSGCIVQVTTQQKNPDGSYVVAEALTFVPDVNIDVKSDPRRLVKVGVVE